LCEDEDAPVVDLAADPSFVAFGESPKSRGPTGSAAGGDPLEEMRKRRASKIAAAALAKVPQLQSGIPRDAVSRTEFSLLFGRSEQLTVTYVFVARVGGA
jgi:hypothetical protein